MDNGNPKRVWYEEFKSTAQYVELLKRPIVYFCAEYAIWNEAPFYAGGLGVLAGDCIQEMADENIPVIALGLYYHRKYITRFDPVSVADENSECVDPDLLGLKRVPEKVSVLVDDREVYLTAWLWQRGNTKLFLLDTRVEENTPEDRAICDILYDESRDMRLRQEIILGIGGMKLLRALGVDPSVYHLNEGHSAFLSFELIRHEIKHHDVDFAEACEYARHHIVFTNHTLVAAGHELFAAETVRRMLKGFALEFGVNIDDLVSLGLEKETGLFSMTLLALRMASKVNAVSALHAKKAVELWREPHVYTVTNGVYIRRWDKLATNDPSQIWTKHGENKERLIHVIKERTGVTFDKDALLLGWARRLVSYKRPLALLGDVQAFKKLANTVGRKIQVVYSGPLNLSYKDKNEFLRELLAMLEGDLAGSVVFLENYNLELSEIMISGCDVWLNTPVVGSEACGTSGMKACLNGVLPLATADGWMYEAPLAKVGWEADDGNISTDLLRILEKEIVPMYYDHIEKEGLNTDWMVKMLSARELIFNQFSATRVLQEYMERFYIPALQSRKHI